jgi:hypothetical protein
VPAIGLADDSVDPELVDRPLFRANIATFRTGWFVESLLTELVIALVASTRRFHRPFSTGLHASCLTNRASG